MFCPKCGKEIQKGARFCAGCGSSLAGGSAESGKRGKKLSERMLLRPSLIEKGKSRGWSGGMAVGISLAAVVLIVGTAWLATHVIHGNRDYDSDEGLRHDASDAPPWSEAPPKEERADSSAEQETEEAQRTVHSFEEVARTGDDRRMALYDEGSEADRNFYTVTHRDYGRTNDVPYGWYDEDGFFQAVQGALEEAGIGTWRRSFPGFDERLKDEHVFFFYPLGYKEDLHDVGIGCPGFRWGYTGALYSVIDGNGCVYFKQGGPDSVYLYLTKDSQEYLEIPYSYDTEANELIFQLDGDDFRFQPYVDSSLYAEGLSNFNCYGFASLAESKWSANYDFGSYFESTYGDMINLRASYSVTRIGEEGDHAGFISLNSSDNVIRTYFKWVQEDEHTVKFWGERFSVLATFTISKDSWTLSIDGKDYSFQRRD